MTIKNAALLALVGTIGEVRLWELDEISLAYAITIHKSQGSEFPAVVIPLATQHYMLLQRNLRFSVVVGLA